MSDGTHLHGHGASRTEGSFRGGAGGIDQALTSSYTEMAETDEKSENQSLTIRFERTPRGRVNEEWIFAAVEGVKVLGPEGGIAGSAKALGIAVPAADLVSEECLVEGPRGFEPVPELGLDGRGQ